MSDDDVIKKAFIDDLLLITNDKDFGEKVYREKYSHKGVILLRLEDERPIIKIMTIKRRLKDYASKLPNSFVVVTETRVRFAKHKS